MDFHAWVEYNHRFDKLYPPGLDPSANDDLYRGKTELPPSRHVPSHSVKTPKGLGLVQVHYRHHHRPSSGIPFPTWMRDLIVTKPWDQLTKAEKRAKIRRWVEEQKKSYIPPWARKLQKIVTELDNVEDVVSSVSALLRLAAYFVPGVGEYLMVASGLLDLASLALDIPKDLIGLALGPMGFKRVGEDVAALGSPRRVLRRALRKEVPSTLKEALPSWGKLIEMGQAALTVFGRGLCLGPIMGKISNMWFAALHKAGISHYEPAHRQLPHRPNFNTRPSNSLEAEGAKILDAYERGKPPAWLESYLVPQESHSPIRFIEIPVHEYGYFDVPTPEEYYALKAWETCYDLLVRPGNQDEELLFAALVAHASTIPYLIDYFTRCEVWRLAEKLGPMKQIPEMSRPTTSYDLVRSEGEDPHVPVLHTDYEGNTDLTYAELAENSVGYVAYRANLLTLRRPGTYEGALAKALVNYLAFAYLHLLDPSSPEQVDTWTSPITGEVYPVLHRSTEVEMFDSANDFALKRLKEYEFDLPPTADNDSYRNFLDRVAAFFRVNNRYPNKKELLSLAFSTLPGLLWRGEFYATLDQLKKRHPYVVA